MKDANMASLFLFIITCSFYYITHYLPLYTSIFLCDKDQVSAFVSTALLACKFQHYRYFLYQVAGVSSYKPFEMISVHGDL